ncbi:MAG TPA: LPXTG cell wall anchor domain-containing protein [Nocardioidaceae bacterium]|nr:LPXTG cell wall anchor domain-containing protein [Nocardioidaceae bacterium]
MSMYDGVRSHASKASTAHLSRPVAGSASRLAAAGLAVFLTVGFTGTAQASGNGQPNESGIENGSLVAVCHDGQTIWVSEPALSAHLDHGDELGACESDTYEGGSEEGGSEEGGSQDGGSEEGGSEEGGSEEGGSQEGGMEGGPQEGGSQEGDSGGNTEDENVEQPAAVKKPTTDQKPAAAEKAADKQAKKDDRDEVLGKDDRRAGDAGDSDEILGVDEAPTANRSAATVLPQTGADDHLALQAGAGLGLLAAGVALLLGRRRVTSMMPD